MAQTFSKLRKETDDRIWYEEKGAFAFLVDAPLTFGHSQLVVAIHPNKEDESFSTVAFHIADCIKKLRTLLPSPSNDKWRALAEYTRSSGPYEKTLVLRVSADEKRNMYKIHLVPYFKSHLNATKKGRGQPLKKDIKRIEGRWEVLKVNDPHSSLPQVGGASCFVPPLKNRFPV